MSESEKPKEEQLDVLFYQLVLSMQANAWTQLGKTASPLTGKIERNLEQAKFSIDMLEMLQRKCRGNMTDEEGKLLDGALYQLRMNYVDEVRKDQEKGDEGKPEEAGTEKSETGPEEQAKPAADSEDKENTGPGN